VVPAELVEPAAPADVAAVSEVVFAAPAVSLEPDMAVDPAVVPDGAVPMDGLPAEESVVVEGMLEFDASPPTAEDGAAPVAGDVSGAWLTGDGVVGVAGADVSSLPHAASSTAEQASARASGVFFFITGPSFFHQKVADRRRHTQRRAEIR